MKKFLVGLLGCLGLAAAPLPTPSTLSVSVDTNGVLKAPLNFFSRNASNLVEGAVNDFTIVFIPDMQYSTGTSYDNVGDWMVAQRSALNIAAVVGLGDFCDGGTLVQLNASTNMAWQVRNAGIPHWWAVGNHDYDGNAPASRPLTVWNSVYPQSYYTAQSWWNGGLYGTENSANGWFTFYAGGVKWLLMGLEFGPSDDVLTWAENVIATHADHKVIIVTHAYLQHTGWRDGAGPSTDYDPTTYGMASANNGELMWQKLVSKYPNIVLVHSGHQPSYEQGIGRAKSVGLKGNVVHEWVADYQADGNVALLRVARMRPQANRVDVATYDANAGGYVYKSEWGSEREEFSEVLFQNATKGSGETFQGPNVKTANVITPTSFGLDDELVFYAPFNKGFGTNAVDVVSGHQGTFQQWAANPAGFPTWGDGAVGNGLVFNNSGSVRWPWDQRWSTLAEMTVSCWVKMSTYNPGIFVSVFNGSTDGTFYFGQVASGVLRFTAVNESSTRVDAQVSVTGMYDNEWHHYAASYNGTTVSFYKDGVLQGSAQASVAGPLKTSFKALYVGDYAGNSSADGTYTLGNTTLDEVRVYRRALTSGDMAYLASEGPRASLATGGTGTSVTFSDPDGVYTATDVENAIVELRSSLGASPNQSNGKVHWSEIIGVPAGFADNADDGGVGGTGDVIAATPTTNETFIVGAGVKDVRSTNAAGVFGMLGVTAFAQGLVDDVDAGTARTTLGAQQADADLDDLADGSLTGSKVGTGINAANVTTGTLPNTVLDATVAAFANLTTIADRLPYFTGVDSMDVVALSSFVRGILNSASASAFRTAIGAGTGNGDLSGPASAVDGTLPVYDGATGKLLKSPTGNFALSGTNASFQGTLFVDNVVATNGVTVLGSGPSRIDSLVVTNSLRVIGSATPTAPTLAGEYVFDTDRYSAGHGALQYWDGTAQLVMAAYLASDTPANGQQLTWNSAAGVPDWQDAGGGGGGSGTVINLTTLTNQYPMLGAGSANIFTTNGWGFQSALFMKPIFNILEFGATPGTGDNRAAIQATIDFAEANNGIAYIPPGKWYSTTLFVRHDNSTILGSGAVHEETAANWTNYLAAYDPLKPVLVYGDNTNYCKGAQLLNITLYGGDSTPVNDFGLIVSSGARRCVFDNVAIWRFTTNLVVKAGWYPAATGSGLECTLNSFNNITIRGASGENDSRGVYYAQPVGNSGSYYTTFAIFDNLHLQWGQVNSSNHIAIEVGSDIDLGRTYIDCYPYRHGILTYVAPGTTANPRIVASELRIDDSGGGTTQFAIWTAHTSSKSLGETLSVPGKLQLCGPIWYGAGPSPSSYDMGTLSTPVLGWAAQIPSPEIQDGAYLSRPGSASYSRISVRPTNHSWRVLSNDQVIFENDDSDGFDFKSTGTLKENGVEVAKVGGSIGAATATTPSAGDNDTSAATTAFVQTEVDSTRSGSHASPNTTTPLSPTWSGVTHVVYAGNTSTINLPAASGYDGRGIIIYNTGAFTITIDPNGSEVVVRDGTAQTGGVNFTLSSGAGNYVALISDGTRWITLGYKGTLAVGS